MEAYFYTYILFVYSPSSLTEEQFNNTSMRCGRVICEPGEVCRKILLCMCSDNFAFSAVLLEVDRIFFWF